MNSKSLYVGYPRSPFKLSAFINALLFLCRTLGLKCFLCGYVLSRPSSNADCIQIPVPDCIQVPAPDYIRGVIDYLGLEKVKRVQPSLMLVIPSMEPTTCN